MPVTRKHRKVLLLCDHRQPLWADKIDRPTPAKVIVKLGFTKQTYTNWKNGEPIHPESIELLCKNFCKAYKENIGDAFLYGEKELISMVNDEALTFSCFTKKLHMDAMKSRLWIEEAICRNMPLFESLCYGTHNRNSYRQASRAELIDYIGTYIVYRLRQYTNSLLICSLEVRYIMQVHDHPDLWALRCKMNVPMTKPRFNKTCFSYDGYVSVKPRYAHWVFEQRDGTEPADDFIFLITERGDVGSGDFFGTCSTTVGMLKEQRMALEPIMVVPYSIGEDDASKNSGLNGLVRVYNEDDMTEKLKYIAQKLRIYFNKILSIS